MQTHFRPNLHLFSALRSLVLLCLATPVAAQDVPQGCFFRDYSDAHLAQNPGQGVDQILIYFRSGADNSGGIVLADVRVLAANQGQALAAGLGGQTLNATPGNFNTPLRFGVECDGGSFDVIGQTGEELTIETQGMRLTKEPSCDGDERWMNLAEIGGETTTYRLRAVDQSQCDAAF